MEKATFNYPFSFDGCGVKPDDLVLVDPEEEQA